MSPRLCSVWTLVVLVTLPLLVVSQSAGCNTTFVLPVVASPSASFKSVIDGDVSCACLVANKCDAPAQCSGNATCNPSQSPLENGCQCDPGFYGVPDATDCQVDKCYGLNCTEFFYVCNHSVGCVPCVGPDCLCFSGVATVLLEDGRVIPMKELRVGDRVQVYDWAAQTVGFDDVYMFAHREPHNTEANGFRICVKTRTKEQHCLELSGDHLLFGAQQKAQPAETIEVGDELMTLSGLATVTSVEPVAMQGLYTPYTHSGTIVVDGMVASTYASRKWSHRLIHALLAPVRAYSSMVGIDRAAQTVENQLIGLHAYPAFLIKVANFFGVGIQ